MKKSMLSISPEPCLRKEIAMFRINLSIKRHNIYIATNQSMVLVQT